MPRLLIVEDDIDIVENLSVLLQDEGYSVCHACNVETALKILHSENIDLVLLDATVMRFLRSIKNYLDIAFDFL